VKRIVEMHHFSEENMASFGYITERQKAAACCVAELLDEIAKHKDNNFGMALLFISEPDMLGDRPVTVWTGLSPDVLRQQFEDYMLKRLKMKEKQTKGTSQNG
jgi:hypothetical protein